MAGAGDLAKMVPGFEFLQTLMKTAGAALPGVPGVPGMSQWIAPTLDPEELEKRIQELKTVQFWLDQNAKLLGGTIQALEVQRMTLSTLKSLNLPMADLRDVLKINPGPAPLANWPKAEPSPAPAPAPEPEAKPASSPAAAPAVDPLQWWGALTQQFTEIATKAVTDSAADAAKHLAGAAVQQTVAAAGRTLKQAVARPAPAAPKARKAAPKKASASRKRAA
jgi:pyruvate/2-oxoglutarate dehydrogenase complex dihydrolipoamide acyltransferase (E2) component